MDSYDVVVIGSGHNALIAAAYLARAGKSVLVLENNDRIGGLVRTEELTLPGFKHDVYSSAHPLFTTSQAYADLGADLTARGLRYINTDIPTGVSFSDGRTAILPQAFEAALAEAERLATGDGAVLGQMLASLNPYVEDIFGLFSMDLQSPTAQTMIQRLLRSETGYSPFSKLLFETARNVVSPFQSPVMQAMLAPWVMHLGRTPDEIGSGLWVYLIVLATMGAGMATPEGGSEQLARALGSLISDHGGVIRTQTAATRIVLSNGKASEVHTNTGEAFGVREHIIASVNPDQLYLRLLADSPQPEHVLQQAKEFRYGRGCVQIHLALSEPPRWPDARFNRIGQPHLTDGLNQCTLAVAQAMAGLLPINPTFTVDCPTNLDPTRAPAGKAIMRIQVLEVPCRPVGDAAGQIAVGDGTWTGDLTKRFVERILAIVERHIPNIPSSVVGLHAVTPTSLAQFSPNLGPGDPYGGAHDLAQSYLLSPLPAQPSHRTLVPNIFMLGAATWPGHGINGGSGYIVAKQLLG